MIFKHLESYQRFIRFISSTNNSAKLINGKLLSRNIKDNLKKETQKLSQRIIIEIS